MDAESNLKEVMLQMHERFLADNEAIRDQIKELQMQNSKFGKEFKTMDEELN